MAGDNSAMPVLDMLSQTVTLHAGDQVISSGDGGLLPPGLPIGTVVADGAGGCRVALLADAAVQRGCRSPEFRQAAGSSRPPRAATAGRGRRTEAAAAAAAGRRAPAAARRQPRRRSSPSRLAPPPAAAKPAAGRRRRRRRCGPLSHGQPGAHRYAMPVSGSWSR